jgi:hypothetical protein
MNEKIKELYKQASKLVCDEPGVVEETSLFYELIPEKFAELIVMECALVAKTLPYTPELHWATDSVTYIPVHCEQNILKHFGVEE